ncbi:MAG: histidine phosphatase family protein [Nakamurella multipartita]
MAEPTAPSDRSDPAGARTLVLMRHAAAGSAVRDHDRPLTPDGVRAATAAGQWLRGHLPAVDVVVCSTAARTRQTLAATGISSPVRYRDELYGGGVDEILAEVAAVPADASTVLVVGHAPTIPATGWELVRQSLLNRDADPSSGAGDELRHFAAGTFAVLSTTGAWADLAQAGAELQLVQHPVA